MKFKFKEYPGFYWFLAIVVAYAIIGTISRAFFSNITTTFLIDLIFIVGIGSFYYYEKKMKNRYPNEIDADLKQRLHALTILGVTVFWIAGQALFLWILSKIGDTSYTEGYQKAMEGNIWIQIFTTAWAAPIAEELIFRYVLFEKILRKEKGPFWLNRLLAYAISVFVFTISHGTFVHLLITIPLGFLCAFIMEWTGRIWYPISLHVFFNCLGLFIGSIYQSYLQPWLIFNQVFYAYMGLYALAFIIMLYMVIRFAKRN